MKNHVVTLLIGSIIELRFRDAFANANQGYEIWMACKLLRDMQQKFCRKTRCKMITDEVDSTLLTSQCCVLIEWKLWFEIWLLQFNSS